MEYKPGFGTVLAIVPLGSLMLLLLLHVAGLEMSPYRAQAGLSVTMSTTTITTHPNLHPNPHPKSPSYPDVEGVLNPAGVIASH